MHTRDALTMDLRLLESSKRNKFRRRGSVEGIRKKKASHFYLIPRSTSNHRNPMMRYEKNEKWYPR